ncbi:MAG: 3-oxoacyl-ACP reductase family protein, partial [Thermoplasmata archaeon]
MQMKDRTCLITGGDRGLGKGLAEAFAREGANLVLIYKTNEVAANSVLCELREKYGSEILICRADVSVEDDVREMVRKAIEKFGGIDILINNAGIFKDRITWKMEKGEWDEVIGTNLTGPFLCIKHVLPSMRERGWGRIINISSVVGEIGVPGTCNYAASKSGLFGLTKTVARECANKNITVNCVALGYFEEGMNLRLPQEVREKILQ